MIQSLEHDEWLLGQLQDAEFAAAYLNAANEDDDPQTYLVAVLKATGLKISIALASGATQAGQ
jgi:DNA-binding phage protein